MNKSIICAVLESEAHMMLTSDPRNELAEDKVKNKNEFTRTNKSLTCILSSNSFRGYNFLCIDLQNITNTSYPQINTNNIDYYM